MNNHRDPEIRNLITRLTDALCQWERDTGRENILIVREVDGFCWRTINGNPEIPIDLDDSFLLNRFGGK